MNIGYGLAFLAGIATFFATCLVPVLPVYLGYLGGLSIVTPEHPKAFSRATILTHSIIFVVGFLLVFSTLGFAATALGIFFARYRELFEKIGGLCIIIFGLGLMDIIRVPLFLKTYRFFIPSQKQRSGSYIGAFVLGLTFGFAWTPCIGPVLATILFLVSFGSSRLYGVLLLGSFALGLGLPFIALGLFFQVMSPSLARLQKATRYVQPILGAMVVLVGILMLTNTLSFVSGWTLHWGGALLL